MQRVVELANTNQGFVMALLTFVYVLATGARVWLAYRQLRQQQQLQREQAQLTALGAKLQILMHLHEWNNRQGTQQGQAFAVQNFRDIQATQQQLDSVLKKIP